jgi:hypothetical protein
LVVEEIALFEQPPFVGLQFIQEVSNDQPFVLGRQRHSHATFPLYST